ncbi:MAG: phosphate signaling complex protein PhoU [Thermoplasmata archaeon]|jgi:phosphate transport system protein|nr:phosphate signaling complex protein PhoU [Thermoplasmata archaeon]MVT13068.1 phosphate signaling complex protein PhoU [Euryarchaeota archaeon]MVT14201.1 phosphate signaling complex protein PhoU [Euryarchaeota archaeon]MVT35882.1 phosphate signaling complex protein PhoU [Euryarchaeota archaeon]
MEKFEMEMNKISKELEVLMGNLEEIMDITLSSLVNIDIMGINKIKEMDIMIYHKTKELETRCVNLILLYSPVAKDLRRLITTMKILMDIDRIGRYSYDISLFIPRFYEKGHLGKPEIIPKMVDQTKKMVRIAIKSFIEENADIAESLQKEDDLVDDLFDKLENEIIEYVKSDINNLERGIGYMLIGKYLERMADHAVNIGDNVIYLIKGEKVIKL